MLFNKLGISTVSMLQIAESLSISAGNLSYHYKNKATLLSVIYTDIENNSLNIDSLSNSYITLHHFEIILLSFYETQKKYTFFFNELVHIARVYPNIIRKYEQTNLTRFEDAKKIIDYYINTGRLIKESEYIDYDKLIYSIFMISTFWQSQNQIISNSQKLMEQNSPMNMFWHLLIPYLTTEGLQEYEQIKKYVKTKKS